MCNRIRMMLAVVLAAVCVSAEELSFEACRRGAANGDPEALYQLAARYENGNGARKDKFKALANYRRAAEKGHRKACLRLAELYENGVLVERNAVEATRYRAKANGESGELAAAAVQKKEEAAKIDAIELAIDYILGRNGKKRDAKTGIRILYQEAKDKPVAQRVFVERWGQGDLDDGLEVLDGEEWALVLPWFKAAFDKGNRKGGLVLGNDAFRKGNYRGAASYWEASGKAGVSRAYYLLGKLYDARMKDANDERVKSLENESKALEAYENCLRLNPNHIDARYFAGLIYLFNKQCRNLNKADAYLAAVLKKEPNDKWVLYYRGLAGYWLQESKFFLKWPKRKFDEMMEKNKRAQSGQFVLSTVDQVNLRKFRKDLEILEENQEPYLRLIRRAAELGCEDARKILQDLERD